MEITTSNSISVNPCPRSLRLLPRMTFAPILSQRASATLYPARTHVSGVSWSFRAQLLPVNARSLYRAAVDEIKARRRLFACFQRAVFSV